jgi:hypothetical protein
VRPAQPHATVRLRCATVQLRHTHADRQAHDRTRALQYITCCAPDALMLRIGERENQECAAARKQIYAKLGRVGCYPDFKQIRDYSAAYCQNFTFNASDFPATVDLCRAQTVPGPDPTITPAAL